MQFSVEHEKGTKMDYKRCRMGVVRQILLQTFSGPCQFGMEWEWFIFGFPIACLQTFFFFLLYRKFVCPCGHWINPPCFFVSYARSTNSKEKMEVPWTGKISICSGKWALPFEPVSLLFDPSLQIVSAPLFTLISLLMRLLHDKCNFWLLSIVESLIFGCSVF